VKTYRITHHKYGVVITGGVPVVDFLNLIKMFEKTHGYHILSADISEHFGASLAMTNDENIGPWRKALGMEEK